MNTLAVVLHGRLRAAPLILLLSAAACSNACGPNVPILTYHTVSDLPEAFALSESDFTGHLDFLKQAGFNTVSLHDLLDHEEKKTPLPPHPIVLTFDDGYQDSYTRVLPALKARGMKGTFFIVAGFCGRDEAHRRIENPGTAHEKRFMLWSEVRALQAAGMEIGSHSLSHARLTTIKADEREREVRDSRAQLANELLQPIEFFAYPYNSERREVRREVERAGYRAAVAGAHSLGDRFELARVGVYHGMTADDLRSQLDVSWAQSFVTGGN